MTLHTDTRKILSFFLGRLVIAKVCILAFFRRDLALIHLQFSTYVDVSTCEFGFVHPSASHGKDCFIEASLAFSKMRKLFPSATLTRCPTSSTLWRQSL
eukprot:g46237.t1